MISFAFVSMLLGLNLGIDFFVFILPSALAVFFFALVSFLLLALLIPQLRLRLLDRPNERSSHKSPTPTGGGIVFVATTVLVSSLLHFSGASIGSPINLLPLLALPLVIVGFLDDCYNLSRGLRYGIQLITATVFVVNSSTSILWFSIPVVIFIFTAVINFTNFMDGLDGLVAGCLAVMLTALSIFLNAPLTIWALVGSLIGFLFWNWSPAKVFMGDVGSTFLGAVFAGLVLHASTWPDAFACLLVGTPILADACICIPRRLLAGQRVFESHRLHLFQRLHQAGWTHAQVSLTYIAATSLLAIALLLGGVPFVICMAVVELFIGIWLDQCVAVPFVFASRI